MDEITGSKLLGAEVPAGLLCFQKIESIQITDSDKFTLDHLPSNRREAVIQGSVAGRLVLFREKKSHCDNILYKPDRFERKIYRAN